MESDRYLRIVKGFGLYHLIASLPLALPGLSPYAVALLEEVHITLALPGNWPTYEPTWFLFLNLFASLAVIWGLLRFRHPSHLLGHYEGWAMVVFTLIVVSYVLQGASVLWLVIALVDGIGALLHLVPNLLAEDTYS